MWKKSSASGANGACVEVAQEQRVVFVRDSKHPQGPVLAFPMTEWNVVISGIRAN
ncbi:MAG TPA: DUF397 domain-containing protein [Pseudonocardiaceae bacterium]|nr:DUF397 domain-containing protein [Pseudonocardiaceae bacterium]